MKFSVKKRLEKIEGIFNRNEKKQYAKVIYDASSEFDPSSLEIEAEVVLFLPDNGKEFDKVDFSEKPYHIFYG